MTKVVIDKATNVVIAIITEKEEIAKDGYDIVTTYADNEPIFKGDNGDIYLNLAQWKGDGTNESIN